jgi:hypothetical protein
MSQALHSQYILKAYFVVYWERLPPLRQDPVPSESFVKRLTLFSEANLLSSLPAHSLEDKGFLLACPVWRVGYAPSSIALQCIRARKPPQFKLVAQGRRRNPWHSSVFIMLGDIIKHESPRYDRSIQNYSQNNFLVQTFFWTLFILNTLC